MKEDWYRLLTEDILSKLNTDEKTGLSIEEVEKRIKVYGKNEIPKKKIYSPIKLFFKGLLDPIVMILIVTVIFSFIIGETVDAVAIIFIILIDLILGAFQEWKAEKNAESLTQMIQVKSSVIRNGKITEIEASNLVKGDIILLESGTKVSADLRIINCQNLQVDESVLTGESINIEKKAILLLKDLPLAERINMLYAGTGVVTGRALAVVVETGINTEIGKIANHVNQTKAEKSPLTIRMDKFSKQISLLILVIAVLLTILLFYKGLPGREIFLSVIALSVSAMPEGLPLALTMALTIGSNRMAKKNVIVKKLNSVESLGSCTVIASDKTGTLTVNEQTAKKIVLPDNQIFEVEGTGYNDNGKVLPVLESDLNRAYYISKLGCINNEALLEKNKEEWISRGDSIDIAFLALGKKIGVDNSDIKILKVIPYESENKYSAVFYKKNNKIHCTVKGSFEKIINFSTKMYENNQEVTLKEEQLEKQNIELAEEGYRVIALADGIIQEETDYTEESIKNLIFTGLVGFIDPIREEVKGSLVKCEKAGIKVIMITGDHPLTAFAIAKELTLIKDYNEVTTGQEVEMMLEKGQKEFDEFIKSKRVFSRVTPIDKLEIVNSLKRQGEFVAVTGDGVNDAPAIRSANIGVAMGSGTDVAKETASMIIIDDNFTSIVAGIEEGRCAYSNIRKVCYMLLSCGLAEVFFFVLSIIFNLPMPLVAIQLLWLNIVTDGLQDFALSFEKTEEEIMSKPPRSTKESIFNKQLFKEVGLSGLVIGLIVFGVWLYLIQFKEMEVSIARGYIVALMVFIQNIHVLNCRSETKSTFKISLKKNPFIIFSIVASVLLQIIVMETPLLSKFLQTSSVPIMDMLLLLCFASIILVVMEIYKKIVRSNNC